MKWSVERKITSIFGLTLLLLSIIGGLSYWNTTRLTDTINWVTHTYKVIAELESVLTNIAIAENSGRGYVITGRNSYLEPSVVAIDTMKQSIKQLKQLTSDNPRQQRRLNTLEPLISKRLAVLTETITLRKSKGFESSLKLVLTDEGKKLTDQIKSTLQSMEKEERYLLQKRSHRAAVSTRNVALTVASGGVLAFGLIPFTILTINRDITRRKRAESQLVEVNEKLQTWVNDLEQRTHEITLLGEMSEVLQACLTVEEAYNAIAYLLPTLFPDLPGSIYTISASKNIVESVADWGNLTTSEKLFGLEDCWGLRRGQIHFVENTNSSGLLCKHLQDTKPSEYCCVPMMAQGEALGILYLASSGGRLTEIKRKLAIAVAEQLSLALANLKLQQQLKSQSIQDPLTGLFNRRYLETTLERELQRARRNQQPMSVIMLDVDYFKRFNDTFGHEAGDAVLRELGQLLQKSIRGSDFACRYGGEELTLVMPGASLEIAIARAEQLRQGVKQLQVNYRGQPLGAIALSLGVASFPEHGSTAESVMRAADAALYKAKNSGRDRVEVAV